MSHMNVWCVLMTLGQDACMLACASRCALCGYRWVNVGCSTMGAGVVWEVCRLQQQLVR